MDDKTNTEKQTNNPIRQEDAVLATQIEAIALQIANRSSMKNYSPDAIAASINELSKQALVSISKITDPSLRASLTTTLTTATGKASLIEKTPEDQEQDRANREAMIQQQQEKEQEQKEKATLNAPDTEAEKDIDKDGFRSESNRADAEKDQKTEDRNKSQTRLTKLASSTDEKDKALYTKIMGATVGEQAQKKAEIDTKRAERIAKDNAPDLIDSVEASESVFGNLFDEGPSESKANDKTAIKEAMQTHQYSMDAAAKRKERAEQKSMDLFNSEESLGIDTMFKAAEGKAAAASVVAPLKANPFPFEIAVKALADSASPRKTPRPFDREAKEARGKGDFVSERKPATEQEKTAIQSAVSMINALSNSGKMTVEIDRGIYNTGFAPTPLAGIGVSAQQSR